MKNDILDRAIAEIRNEEIDPAVVESAAARVRARVLTAAASDAGLHQIHGCADFQLLIAGYLAGRLSEARRLLLEDHTHSCVHCRHALESAQSGKVRTLPRPVLVERRVAPQWKWAVAAALAMTIAGGAWGLYRSMAPDPGIRAVVQSVSGILYAVGNNSTAPIFAGREVADHQPVRTFENSDAMLRLTDGSEVELAPRSEVWIGRVSRETTVHLTRGSIIVHAAKQKTGALHVATVNCLVSVKGTIFAVTEGTKGSRVSVVEGAVQVKQGSHISMLRPGDQATTSPAVGRTSVQDEISWSRNSGQYLALLGEFSSMAKQLAQAPQPGMRYSSKLADLAPPNTVVYGAMPNIGPLLSEANRIFDDRLATSQVLRDWWNQHQAPGTPSLDEIVQRVRTFSDYLGNEIALSVTLEDGSKDAVPLLMAEVTRPGLADYLQQINTAAGKPVLNVLTALPKSSTPNGADQLYAFISGNFLFISPALQPLAQADAAVKDSGSRGQYRLYSRVEQAYQSGVGWLLAADMEQIRDTSVHSQGSVQRAHMQATGIENLDAFVLQRRDVNGVSQDAAALSFAGNRSGMAAWLAAPGPIGSLDFVSPDASMVTAATIKDHGRIVWDLLDSVKAANASAKVRVEDFEGRNGWPMLGALANSLGGDFTFAVDGALLPIPSWKFAVEVYNPSNCEWALEQIVNGLNQDPNTAAKVHLTKADDNGRTFYTITADGFPLEIHYVFVDNYLLAAASQSLLTQAIQNRGTGYTLTRSATFRAQFPSDGNVNFSGIVYYNAGPALNAVSQTASAFNVLTPAQKASIASLAAASKPGLVYAYGEPDRILVSSTSGFFGLNLDTLSLPAVVGASMTQQLRIGHDVKRN